MGYRKIEVDGKTYEYVIGRKFVKFRGGKAIPHSEIGVMRDRMDEYVITPKLIAAYLKGGVTSKSYFCEEHKFLCTKMTINPYAIEIYGKNIPIWNCPKCVEQLGWDI